MELDEKGGKILSAYEMALERHGANVNKLAEQESQNALFAKNDGEYDESFFVPVEEFNENSPPPQEERPYSPQPILPGNLEHEELEELIQPEIPDVKAKEFPVACHYSGPIFDYGGYARMNRTYIFGLTQKGGLVKTDPIDSIDNVNKKTGDALRGMMHTDVPNYYPKIYGMTVPPLIAHAGRKILYTMMETSRYVHPEYAERLHLGDEVWVPTKWCKDVLENTSQFKDIRIMPLGVDTSRYMPGLEPLEFKGANLKKFRFLSVFGWSYRKGFDVLIRAYLEEFSNEDDVSLILTTRFAGSTGDENRKRIQKDFNLTMEYVDKPIEQMPHIALHSAYTAESKMPNLYNSAHCFCLISRGEGFGLPYCEAGACGLPVIASNHGGQKDFLDEEVAEVIDPDGYYMSTTKDPPFQNMAWISHFYEDQFFPRYDRPAINKVRAAMRKVYENYSEAKAKADKLRKRINDHFSWDHCVQKVYDRLAEICEEIYEEENVN
jgi:glycosyltransferase involved in cell wall biosynthesis